MRKFTSWAVALAILAIVVFNVQGWLVFNRTSRAFERELGDRLLSIATTLSASLGTGYDTEASRRVFRVVMRDNRLFNLFVVNEGLEYIVNIGDPSLEGKADRALQPDMAEVLSAFSGIPTQSRLYRAGRYLLKTAYVGLEDESGTIGAVLGVEADANFFADLASFRNALLLINALSLLAILAVAFVSASMARHALRLERAASRANTLALMGQMSAAVAHEIRNPLGIIRASAERLKSKYGRDTGDPTFDYIQEEVDRLSGVVSNYLGIGRGRPGASEKIDLGEVIRGVADDLAPQAQKQGVNITSEFPPLPAVTGNRSELRQVFLNLVLNAVQAQPDGGIVEMRAGVERLRGGEYITVSVTDRGPGIDPKEARLIFEPFRTTREKGSGLGLFVVKRIIEEHRGEVTVESRPGEGARFKVRLPV